MNPMSEEQKERNRICARNAYRLKKGIPLDAPITQGGARNVKYASKEEALQASREYQKQYSAKVDMKGYLKKYYAEHKEEAKEYYKKYYAEHKEEANENRAKYYAEHKEEAKENQAKYYAKHKEQIKEYHIKYFDEHKEQIKEYQRKYHAEHKEELKAKANKKKLLIIDKEIYNRVYNLILEQLIV